MQLLPGTYVSAKAQAEAEAALRQRFPEWRPSRPGQKPAHPLQSSQRPSRAALEDKIAPLVAKELALRLPSLLHPQPQPKPAPALVAAFEESLKEQRHAAQRAGFKAIVTETRRQNELARQARQQDAPPDSIGDLRRLLERWQAA